MEFKPCHSCEDLAQDRVVIIFLFISFFFFFFLTKYKFFYYNYLYHPRVRAPVRSRKHLWTAPQKNTCLNPGLL